MVLLNGQEFVIYGMDSHQTIIERIATRLGTLPKYVNAPLLPDLSEGDPNQSDFNIVAYDLLTRIREYNNQGDIKRNVQDFLNYLGGEDLWPTLSKRDIATLWVTYNDRLTERSYIVAQRYMDRAFAQERPIPIEQIKRRSMSKKAEIQREIERAANRTGNMKDILDHLDHMQPKPFTGLVLSSTVREIGIPRRDIPTRINTLSHLFDLIQLHKTTPFASLGKFYKILYNFTTPPEWSIALDDTIIIRTLMGIMDIREVSEETDKEKNKN
jgi:hypothetical protein